MAIQVYINFDGNCREAVTYYQKVFETNEPNFMTFGSMPPSEEHPIPDAAKDLVMHTELVISGDTVMFSDTWPGMPLVVGNNISLTIVDTDMDKIKAWFAAMKVDGTVEMDLQETFWSKCYGSLKDKFGIIWQFSYKSE